MQIRSFILAYSLVLAILLFADRRPASSQQDHFSHVVDLTEGQNATAPQAAPLESKTRIIAPGALIPGTWNAGQIPAERLIAPLIVMDSKTAPGGSAQISLDDISAWETLHGMIPPGAVVAVRGAGAISSSAPFPITHDAAMFFIDGRSTIGFALDTPVDLTLDRTLARQLALHGSYVVTGATHFASLPVIGSLVIVAPAKGKTTGEAPVRILAMVR